jgi:hypothetical protein
MKLLIMQLLHPPATSCLLCPTIFLSTLFPNILYLYPSLYMTIIFMYIQNNSLNYSWLYFNPYAYRQHTGRKTILHQMVACIPKISFVLNFFTHIILICQCHSKIFKLYQIFKGFISYLCVMYCSAFFRRNIKTYCLLSAYF